jgi:hypothetical protein
MTFVSFEYLVLLAGTFAVYFLLPWRPRILFLLAANYVFYAYWSTGTRTSSASRR